MRTSPLTVVALACLSLILGCEKDSPGEPPVEYDRELMLSGLESPVEAHLDEHGVLHLSCESDADCFFAEGYYHASHRFFQMELRRRLTQGLLSEIAGPAALNYDITYRELIARPDGSDLLDEVWAQTDEATRAAIEAYSRGVTAWIQDWREERHGAITSPEFDLGILNLSAIRDWEPRDSLACILALLDSLTNDAARELAQGEAYARLSPEMARDLLGVTPASDSAIIPSTMVPLAGPLPQEPISTLSFQERLAPFAGVLTEARERLQILDRDESRGSNNWVLGPERANGVALLSNDPHLGLSNASIWYLVHMDSKTRGEGSLHIAGVSFAGLPGIVLGHNEDIAWGATNSYFDFSDVYTEDLSPDGEGVMFNGTAVPFVQREFTIPVNGADPTVHQALFVPHHGPVLSIDRDAGKAISMAWTGQRATTDFNFLLGLMTSTNAEQARDALRSSTTVGQNFVVADRGGNIGWFPYNQVPSRPWASAEVPNFLPVPGNGTAEWEGHVAYEDLPQVYNPASAYIATANNDMTGAFQDGDPTNDGEAALQNFVAPGYRHERIVERILAEPTHDRASMESILADVHSLLGERTVPSILEGLGASEAELSAGAREVQAALAAWDFDCPSGLDGFRVDSPASGDEAERTSAIGCAAFHVLWPRIKEFAFGDELSASGVTMAAEDDALVFALTQPSRLTGTYWDSVETEEVETQTAIIAQAAEAASVWLMENLGAERSEWLWGRVHTITLRADLLDTAGVTDYNNGPYANDGGNYTVDVARPGSDMSHRSGASMRLACAVSPEGGPACTIQLPGGQRHFPDDMFYENLFHRWLENRPIELGFDVAAVRETAAESTAMLPAGVSP